MYPEGVAARLSVGGALAVGGAILAASALSPSVLWAVPPTGVALYLAYRGHVRRLEKERRTAHQMAELQLATIEALALAIDAQDETAPNHIRRVQTLASGLARAIGMSEVEVQAVRTAALLHDIGKLAVPDHIRAKPGPLTPEEFQKVRVHPQVGAEIIRSVPFPYPVAPLILSHHERWDGLGYPSGLKESEIPLGARVLSVVDYFDALTSDRPYHKAISAEAAISLLQQESGKALDPRVIDVFVAVAPGLLSEAGHTDVPAARLPSRQAGREPEKPWRQQRHEIAEAVRVRRHRDRAQGNSRAVRDRPVDGHRPRGLGDDGTDRGAIVESRPLLGLRLVPAL